MEHEVHREVHTSIGRHDAQIEGLQRQVETLHKDMTNVLAQLQSISSTLSEAKGGWRTLMAVAGFASIAGGVAVKFASFLLGR